MPFKANTDRRHHFAKQRHRVTNPAAYDAALRQRVSLTVWFTDEAIAAWKAEPRTTRGAQPRYSALAIATALTLRAVFRLALRQTEGLIGCIIALLGLNLAVPDNTTLSRRVAPVPGQEATGLAGRAGRNRMTLDHGDGGPTASEEEGSSGADDASVQDQNPHARPILGTQLALTRLRLGSIRLPQFDRPPNQLCELGQFAQS